MGKLVINFPNADSAQLAGATIEGSSTGDGGGSPTPPGAGGVQILGQIGNPQHPPLMGNGVNREFTLGSEADVATIQLGEDVTMAGFTYPSGRCIAGLGSAPGLFDLTGEQTSADQATIQNSPATGKGTWLSMKWGEGHSVGGAGKCSANR